MSDQKSGLKTPFDHSTRFVQKRVHLGICGSVACYRAADLLRAWRGLGMHVSVTLTPVARRFVTPMLFESLALRLCMKTCLHRGRKFSPILSRASTLRP